MSFESDTVVIEKSRCLNKIISAIHSGTARCVNVLVMAKSSMGMCALVSVCVSSHRGATCADTNAVIRLVTV